MARNTLKSAFSGARAMATSALIFASASLPFTVAAADKAVKAKTEAKAEAKPTDNKAVVAKAIAPKKANDNKAIPAKSNLTKGTDGIYRYTEGANKRPAGALAGVLADDTDGIVFELGAADEETAQKILPYLKKIQKVFQRSSHVKNPVNIAVEINDRLKSGTYGVVVRIDDARFISKNWNKQDWGVTGISTLTKKDIILEMLADYIAAQSLIKDGTVSRDWDTEKNAPIKKADANQVTFVTPK